MESINLAQKPETKKMENVNLVWEQMAAIKEDIVYHTTIALRTSNKKTCLGVAEDIAKFLKTKYNLATVKEELGFEVSDVVAKPDVFGRYEFSIIVGKSSYLIPMSGEEKDELSYKIFEQLNNNITNTFNLFLRNADAFVMRSLSSTFSDTMKKLRIFFSSEMKKKEISLIDSNINVNVTLVKVDGTVCLIIRDWLNIILMTELSKDISDTLISRFNEKLDETTQNNKVVMDKYLKEKSIMEHLEKEIAAV